MMSPGRAGGFSGRAVLPLGLSPRPLALLGRGAGHEKLCNSAFSVLRVFLRPIPPPALLAPSPAGCLCPERRCPIVGGDEKATKDIA